MQALIKLTDSKEVMQTKEGYQTIIGRAFDSNFFLKATFKNGRKVVINKTAIEHIQEAKLRKQQNEG